MYTIIAKKVICELRKYDLYLLRKYDLFIRDFDFFKKVNYILPFGI